MKKIQTFTLTEVLAAMLLIAVVLPAILQASKIAMSTYEASQRRLRATELGNNMLNTWLIEDTWSDQDESGTMENESLFRWEFETQAYEDDTTGSCTELNLKVYYPVTTTEHFIEIVTLVTTEEETDE